MSRKSSGSKTKANKTKDKSLLSRVRQLPFGVRILVFAVGVLILSIAMTYGYTKWESSKVESELRASASQWTLIKNNPSSVSVYACYKERKPEYMDLRVLFVRNKTTNPDGSAWLPPVSIEIVENANNPQAGIVIKGEQLAWYQTVSMMASYARPNGGLKTNFSNNYTTPSELQPCPDAVN